MKQRIVSLLASATEIVCALGLEDRLVGRSHECDFPPSVRRLPQVTAPKIDVDASSREIDGAVKGLVEAGLSVYHVDAEAIRSLQPDLVVTQAQCEVCAVSLADVESALREWTGSRPSVVSLEPSRLDDIWEDVQRVADVAGKAGAGRELAERLRARVRDVAGRTASLDRPSTACIEWIDPPMAAGHWIPELVEVAGGHCVLGVDGGPAPWLEWPELVDADPEVIVVFPCGFDLERTRAEIDALTTRADWSGLRAVRDRRVYLADGNSFFNRSGPRIVESIEMMAEMLHPERFEPHNRGSAWEPLGA